MRGDGQLQDRRVQQSPARHVELTQQLRQARVSPGRGWVSNCSLYIWTFPAFVGSKFKSKYLNMNILYFPCDPPAVMLHPGFGKSWHISPSLCQALFTPTHLPDLTRDKKSSIYLRSHICRSHHREVGQIQRHVLSETDLVREKVHISRQTGYLVLIPRAYHSCQDNHEVKNARQIKANRLMTRLNWNFQANRRCWDFHFSAKSKWARSVFILGSLI